MYLSQLQKTFAYFKMYLSELQNTFAELISQGGSLSGLPPWSSLSSSPLLLPFKACFTYKLPFSLSASDSVDLRGTVEQFLVPAACCPILVLSLVPFFLPGFQRSLSPVPPPLLLLAPELTMLATHGRVKVTNSTESMSFIFINPDLFELLACFSLRSAFALLMHNFTPFKAARWVHGRLE